MGKCLSCCLAGMVWLTPLPLIAQAALDAGAQHMQAGEAALNAHHDAEALAQFRAAADLLAGPADRDRRVRALDRAFAAAFRLGREQQDPAALTLAADSARAGLAIRSRADQPLDWAWMQLHLGIVLFLLGEQHHQPDLVPQAITAYRAALEEFSADRTPREWTMTQTNLATALSAIGEREKSAPALEQAIAAYRAVLPLRPRETQPVAWATTANNLGNALRALAKLESGTERLEEARALYEAALSSLISTNETAYRQWTEENLQKVRAELAARGRQP